MSIFFLLGLSSLSELRISDNQITQIVAGQFKDLVNLQLLDLDGNEIATLHADAFQGT